MPMPPTKPPTVVTTSTPQADLILDFELQHEACTVHGDDFNAFGVEFVAGEGGLWRVKLRSRCVGTLRKVRIHRSSYERLR